MNALSKFLTATAAVACLAGAATTANAATNFTQINLINGSSIFGATTDDAGVFTHTFDFTIVEPGTASSSVITVSLDGLRDIDFTSIDLDGTAFTMTNPDPVESWGLTLAALGVGLHTITLNGSVAPGEPGLTGSYAGTLNINFDGGGGNEIPEPGTWALMIVGFGGAGAMLRRRRLVVA